MERIKCAAVKYEQLSSPGIMHVVTGETHAKFDIRLAEAGILRSDIKVVEEGYHTTYDRFVSKEEAYIIADKAGQLLSHKAEHNLHPDDVRMCGVCRMGFDGFDHVCDCFLDFYYDPLYNKHATGQQ